MAKFQSFSGIAVLTGFAIILMTPTASAGTIAVGDQIAFTPSINHPLNSDGTMFMGGAFRLYLKASGAYVYQFDTFCVEANETMDLRALDNPLKQFFRVVDVSKTAILGGIKGRQSDSLWGTSDPISGETAWLYEQWRLGTLNTGGYSPADIQKGIQLAVWWFEGESAYKPTTGPGKYFTNLAMNASAEDKSAALRVVWVINPVLTSAAYPYRTSDFKQSVLMLQVPESSLPICLGIGIAGILALAWRYGRE